MSAHQHHKKADSLKGNQDKPQAQDGDCGAANGISDKGCHALEQQAAEYKEKYLRVLAEFENARKRQDRERAELIKYANEHLMLDFLNIVDDLDRVVLAAREKHQDYDSFLKGVEMVMKRVSELLKKHGVQEVVPVGEPFDPYAHEILMQEPSAGHQNGTVMESFQKGYKIGGKVIRTAKVKVAVNPQDGEVSGVPGQAEQENEQSSCDTEETPPA